MGIEDIFFLFYTSLMVSQYMVSNILIVVDTTQTTGCPSIMTPEKMGKMKQNKKNLIFCFPKYFLVSAN